MISKIIQSLTFASLVSSNKITKRNFGIDTFAIYRGIMTHIWLYDKCHPNIQLENDT